MTMFMTGDTTVGGDVAEDLGDNFDDVVVIDTVELASPVTAGSHDTCRAQLGELLACGRDGGAGRIGEAGDVVLLFSE